MGATMAEPHPTREIIVGPTARAAAECATSLVLDIIRRAAEARECCSISLAGGATPRPLYECLARQAVGADVPWSCVDVFYGDERDVPEDHVESNYHLTQRALLDHVPIRPSRVHPMWGAAPDIAAAAREYERTIRRIVPAGETGIPRFDLILLGMGGDGHIASLFPDCPEILAESEKLVAGFHVPFLGRNRMSFTLPLINAASNVLLFITGEEKSPVVARLLSDDPEARRHLPASGVAPTDGTCYLVFDAAAARLAGLSPG